VYQEKIQKQYRLRTDKAESNLIHDTELELDVLATIAFVPDQQYKITILTEDDFYSLNSKEIYRAFLDMFVAGKPIDLPAIDKNLKSNKVGLSLFNRQATVIPSQLDHRIERLKDISGKRRVQEIAYEMTAMVASGKGLKEVRDFYSGELLKVGQEIYKDKTTEDLDGMLEEYLTEKKDPAIRTGFPKLDQTTGGFMNGTLNIIASAQGLGKTTLIVNMFPYICGKQGKSILIVSLEMTFMSMHAKMVSNLSGVSFSKLMYGNLNSDTDNWQAINEARAKISEYRIDRLGEREITTADIRSKIKSCNPDIVFVDYMQLLKPISKGSSMYETITNISRELKILASESGIPFVVIASINRDYSDRGDNRPKISDIRGSGNIEYDADLVLLLHRESMYRDYDYNRDSDFRDEYEFEHGAEITIAKNRFGESNLRIDMYFDGEKSFIGERTSEAKKFV
jgi:replicative DNA helicase